jgi:DNA polymerase-1
MYDCGMSAQQTNALRPGDQLFLVDGSSYIFRAYHALPPLTRKSDGLPVGAVAGFCNMLWKLMQDSVDGKTPTHLAVIFDHSSKSFRNDFYDQYKAHRPDPPEDLRPQFGLIRQAVEAFSLPSIELANYEADDLIATYARQAEAAGADVTIIASDKDLMQLVSDRIVMFDTMKDRRIDAEGVVEKFGVPPEKVVDVQALAGDSVDNIPGVPGIGVKTAAQLIETYGDVDTLVSRAAEIKQPKRRQSIIEHAENARISRRLAELMTDVPVEVPVTDFVLAEPDARRLIAFLKALEFTTITRRVAEATQTDASVIEPAEITILHWDAPQTPSPASAISAAGGDVSADAPENIIAGHTPRAMAERRAAEIGAIGIDPAAYETVTTLGALQGWIARSKDQAFVALDTETNSLDAMQADLVGVSLALSPGKACYIPLQHKAGDGSMFDEAVPDQVPLKDAVAGLKPLLEDRSVLKIGQNIKYDALVLSRHGITLENTDDTMLLSYVLDAGMHGHGMDALSEMFLGHKPIAYSEITGTGRNKITFDQVPIDAATAYAAEDADITLRLWLILKARLAPEQMVTVYERLERPMVSVLTRMEERGVAIDRAMLARLSGDFAQSMGAIESEIHTLAGEEFNLGSPKQLGDILFGKMALPGAKKTKTGAWTTGASVLEELAAEGHELPARVLEWRGMQKLKSTYTDALPGYVHPETGRVHTSYSLAATTTGRLSSSEPNLQNIPIRTEAGRKIRQAFVPEKGFKLVSADYSQIELRILAHIADIPALKQAFADGLDIHAMTASEMFDTPIEGMDPMVRRRAKAINFGIIYGISAFGLANQLSIPREEAGAYIKRYFERFPGIKDYMDATKAFVREHGYVTTIFGRKCHYPNVTKGHPSERAFFERAAINAPIQGSAADIIRRAMVRMEDRLCTEGLNARMLLQVHDELIFEVPDDEVDTTLPVIADVMENAPLPALQLSVPLQVDARAAQNWDEAH